MKINELVIGEWYAIKAGPSSTSCDRAMVIDTTDNEHTRVREYKFNPGVRGVGVAFQYREDAPVRFSCAPPGLIVGLWSAYEAERREAQKQADVLNASIDTAWSAYEARIEACVPSLATFVPDATIRHADVPTFRQPPKEVTIPLEALEKLLALLKAQEEKPLHCPSCDGDHL